MCDHVHNQAIIVCNLYTGTQTTDFEDIKVSTEINWQLNKFECLLTQITSLHAGFLHARFNLILQLSYITNSEVMA